MRVAMLGATALAAGVALAAFGTPPAPAGSPPAAARGQALFSSGCASCHGLDARGVSDRGPSLRGVGAASIDFYLGTGRMPLAQPGTEPSRAAPRYGRMQQRDLIAYLTGLDPRGPPIPAVDPGKGSIVDGRRLFADSCSGCHQIMGRGGVAPGLAAPPLTGVTPTQIGEAIRVGPYLMPRFSAGQFDTHDVDSIARYITQVGQSPPDRGGWAIGNIGPIPEGLIAFFLLGGGLVLVARVIGERAP